MAQGSDHTDEYYCEQYRQTLANHEDEIVDVLKRGVWEVLLTRLNPSALTREEWDRISSAYTNKTDKAKAILSLVRSKDNLSSYIGFSRALCDTSRCDKRKVFPFVSELERAGRHPPVERNRAIARCPMFRGSAVVLVGHRTVGSPKFVAAKLGKTKQTVYMPSSPVNTANILWVVQSKLDFDRVPLLLRPHGKVSEETEAKFLDTDFMLKTITISVELAAENSESVQVTLHLTRPIIPKPNYKAFFSRVPRPNLVLFTSTGSPLGGSVAGDVVVVARGDPTAVCGEVEHVTGLWKLNRRKQRRDPSEQHANVVFGRATRKVSHEDPDFLVRSEEVVRFYSAADEILPGVHTLAVVELLEGHTLASDSLNLGYLNYCCELVHYFSRKFL